MVVLGAQTAPHKPLKRASRAAHGKGSSTSSDAHSKEAFDDGESVALPTDGARSTEHETGACESSARFTTRSTAGAAGGGVMSAAARCDGASTQAPNAGPDSAAPCAQQCREPEPCACSAEHSAENGAGQATWAAAGTSNVAPAVAASSGAQARETAASGTPGTSCADCNVAEKNAGQDAIAGAPSF